MDKVYDHKKTEEKLYETWEKKGYFKPEVNSSGEPYTITLPPPNVTGTLHMGHALMLIIQDILIRYKRMQGKKALWLPGTDHAAIATQSKVEALLYKEQEKTKTDLGREAFLQLVEDFAQKSHDTIVHQMKRIGASVDWEREAYTLDEKRSFAVRTAFKTMYEAGLIYRGSKIVNWDPKLQTTVSDDEVEWTEEQAPFYYIQYGPFVIATARPETKFGDKYVVMHPADKRYAAYTHGQKIPVQWINGEIVATVIKDKAVDMSFGTGVMTITPWHDRVDFDIAENHTLDKEQIIDFSGKLLPIAGEFAGMHIKKARPLIVEKLQEKGLLVRVDDKYTHRIATNSRGGGIIEPQIKMQWFVDVNKEVPLPHSEIAGITSGSMITLKKLMRHVVDSKQIEIVPKHFEKIYFHWIDNLRDWCISRQIWYGHRIPVWYKGKEMYCGIEAPSGDGWEQDPDTLDTWFSSGLWTFSTLGWPDKTADLTTFHPTDVLETGYDILFFWVARMILMTTYLRGQIPFKTVLLHGLVRDAQKQKMSKSKGNIIDPLDISDTYGTDALRIALVFSTAAGNDIPLSEDKIRGMRNFTNKLWNIARFFEFQTTKYPGLAMTILSEKELFQNTDDVNLEKMKHSLQKLIQEVSANLDKYQFHLAAERLYEFTWHEFADIYIEQTKQIMENADEKTRQHAFTTLVSAYNVLLTLLHPFMPFITEELYQSLTKSEESIMLKAWPSVVKPDLIGVKTSEGKSAHDQ